MNIGLIGLGSMGYNLAKNLISKDFTVHAFEKNDKIIKKIASDKILKLHLESSLKELCNKTPSPRIIMLSLPANKIDQCIDELTEYLNPNDIIADLGNSLYLKSIERYRRLSDQNIDFLGVGVSGGPRGAKLGPAIMSGGSHDAWNKTKHIFHSIAAKNNSDTACCYFGSAGAGHFVKLIHNGIEYALMESLAEISCVLMNAFNMDQENQANALKKILNTETSSFLLEITSKVLNAKNDADQYFIDQIDNEIGQNGTGTWTINAALELGVSIPSIYSAVSTRSSSNYFNYKKKELLSNDKKPLLDFNDINLEEIIFFNFACSLYQGLTLIEASNKWDYFDFKLKDIFKAWSAGCILQGKYLKLMSTEYNQKNKLDLNFLYNIIHKKTSENLLSIRKFNAAAINLAIPSPVLSANLAYYDLMFSEHKIGETIQLQRSFFGLHPLKEKETNKVLKPYWTKL
jgi:6-phosphogluconate dehydrogenase